VTISGLDTSGRRFSLIQSANCISIPLSPIILVVFMCLRDIFLFHYLLQSCWLPVKTCVGTRKPRAALWCWSSPANPAPNPIPNFYLDLKSSGEVHEKELTCGFLNASIIPWIAAYIPNPAVASAPPAYRKCRTFIYHSPDVSLLTHLFTPLSFRTT
jgi:hypothetical protein